MIDFIFGLITLISFIWPWVMFILAATVLTRILGDIGSFLGGQSEREKTLEKDLKQTELDLELSRQQIRRQEELIPPRSVNPYGQNWVQFAKEHPSATLHMMEKFQEGENGQLEAERHMKMTVPFSERPQASVFPAVGKKRKRLS